MTHDRDDASDPAIPVQEDDRGFRTLLQGKEAWWHFLEAKGRGELTPELNHDAAELQLEQVGRIAQREERQRTARFELHSTRNVLCDACGAQIPADLSVCVHCGRRATFVEERHGHLLIIDEVEERDVLDEVAELIGASNDALNASEILSALQQPPAVFSFPGSTIHGEALVARLGELGVRASVEVRSTRRVSMPREVVESILRSPVQISLWLAAFVIWGVALLFVPLFGALAGALVTFIGLYVWHAQTFVERYEIDVESILDELTGMDRRIKYNTSEILRALRDEEVRRLLTLCLMEYYAIWRQLSAAPPSMRPLLNDLRVNLRGLLYQILDACARYVDLHSYFISQNLDALAAELESLDERWVRSDDPREREVLTRQMSQRQRQLKTAREVEAMLPPFRQRLSAMCSSMEALRARVVSMTLTRASTSEDEALVEQIMLDLDDELHVFERTLAEVEVVEGASI